MKSNIAFKRPVVLLAVGLLAIWCLGAIGCGYTEEAREVTWQETRPMVLIKKYRAFKDMAAKLDAQQADILAKKKSLKRLETRLASAKNDRVIENLSNEQSLQEQEIYGLISSFNAIASDYNRRMADIGWAFCNVGKMPAGLEEESALKRSYATYKTE